MYTDALEQTTTHTLQPRLEGLHVGDMIGFKHIMYLAEDAVVRHFRGFGLGVGRLSRDWNVGMKFVSSHGRIASAVRIDDDVSVQVTPKGISSDGTIHLAVAEYVVRDGKQERAYSGKVAVRLQQVTISKASGVLPAELRPLLWRSAESASPGATVSTDGAGPEATDGRDGVLAPGANGFVMCFRNPYFYCGNNYDLQMSGYLRYMESAAELFLEERGISVHRMLDTKQWIPFVSKTGVDIHCDVHMEEEVTCAFIVQDIFRDLMYTAVVKFYVQRGGQRVNVATGHVTHGYCEVEGHSGWKMVPFDEEALAAIRGTT